jgi:hypothetical protein
MEVSLAATWTARFGASIFGALAVREAIFGNWRRRGVAACGVVFAIVRACGDPPPGPLFELDKAISEITLATFFVALAGMNSTSLGSLFICSLLVPVGYSIMGSGRPVFSWVALVVSVFDGATIPIGFLALVTAGFTVFAAYVAQGERDLAIAALGTYCPAAVAAGIQILPTWPLFTNKGEDEDSASDTTSVTAASV